jgi:hypothetical protein
VPKIPGAKQHDQGNGHPDEDRDIDRLAKARPCPLVLQRVQETDEFVLFELPVAARADLEGVKPGRILDGNVRNKRDRPVRIEGLRRVAAAILRGVADPFA